MTAKEYLRQVAVLDKKIEQKTREKDDLINMAAGLRSPTNDPNKVQTSAVGDRMADTIARYVDIENEINSMIYEYVAKKDKIINEIHSLSDVRYIELLYLRYIPDAETHRTKRLDEIAEIMKRSDGQPYSCDHIVRMHGKALESFYKKILK